MKQKTFIFISVALFTIVIIQAFYIFRATKGAIRSNFTKSCEHKKNLVGRLDTIHTEKFTPPKGAKNFHNNIPLKGFVPDAKTAISIAEAIWLPIYDKDIYKDIPFNVSLLNDSLWMVSGTNTKAKHGSFFIVIQKKDGKVLEMSHNK